MDLNEVALINSSDIEQRAYLPDGKSISMAPQEIRTWPRDMADVLLAQRGKYIQPYRPLYIPPSPGEAITYIANVTGNPHAPEMLTKKRFDKSRGIEEEFQIPNPIRVAKILEYELQSEQVVQMGQGGSKESYSFPPKRVKVPSTMRLPVPRSVAEWLIRRDAQGDDDSRGSLIECRGPSDFEPNESWPLEDMLLYASMVDKQANWKKFAKGEDDHEKKLNLYRAVFNRLVDERFQPVPRMAFEAEKALRVGANTPPAQVSRNSGSSARA